MEIYGLTDRGVVREANEDSIGISRTKNGITIAVVCDGMGGAAGGRIASEIAEETFMSAMLAWHDGGYKESPADMAKVMCRMFAKPLFPNLDFSAYGR